MRFVLWSGNDPTFMHYFFFSIDVLPLRDEIFRTVIGFGMIHIIAKMSITESLT